VNTYQLYASAMQVLFVFESVEGSVMQVSFKLQEGIRQVSYKYGSYSCFFFFFRMTELFYALTGSLWRLKK
jgi:hypothetical protein